MKRKRTYGTCECGGPIYGYKSPRCRSCYFKFRKGKPYFPLEERFFRHVNKTPYCWQWTGASRKGSYGYIRINGRLHKVNRVAWELFKGKIPDGKYVLHKCDNTKCVNPEHLWLGTQKENMADMKAKGRAKYVNGEDAGMSKLNNAKVRAIRASYPKKSLNDLGRKFNVCLTTIHKIVNRKTWKHVTAS